MKRKLLAVSLFIFLILQCSNAMAFLHVEGRYWFTNLSGVTNVSNGAAAGTGLSLVNGLGLPEQKDFWEARISLELGNHQIRYGYLPMQWSGSRSIAGTINFNGQAFTGKIDSTLNANYHRLGYKYDFINILGSDAGVIAEIKYFDSTIGLSGPGIPESRREISGFFPTVGASGHLGLPYGMNFGGELTAGGLSYDKYTADGELALNFNAIPNVTMSGGYRALIVYMGRPNVKEHLNLTGPFVLMRAGF